MAIDKTKPVLVTGVNGFIAAWVALKLLQKGYHVRGTSRSQAKFDAFLAANKEFKQAHDDGRLTFALIEDVASSDFTKALQGVEVVMHTASPFHMKGGDAEETYLRPALKGTLNVLEASHKAGTVKNFIVTSSFAAVLDMNDGLPLNGKTYTEKNWNSATYESSKNSDSAPYNYCASKKLAEEAAYKYQKDNKLEGKMCIASLCPPTVFGPWVHPLENLDSLNESNVRIWKLFSGQMDDVPPTPFAAGVDVRDVAEAHIVAAEQNEQGRFILSGGKYDNQQVADWAQEWYPKQYKGPKGNSGQYLSDDPKVFTLSADKARKELGIKFLPPKESIHNAIEQMVNFSKA